MPSWPRDRSARLRLALVAGALAAWLVFGFLGRATGSGVLDVLAGVAFVAALVAGAGLFLRRAKPDRKPERLFPPVGQGRWCDRCGHVTGRQGPCQACGHEPPPRRRLLRSS